MTFLRSVLLLACMSFTLSYAQTISCPPNIDFEDGDLDHWEFFTGTCCPIGTPTAVTPVAGRHEITTGGGTDPYGGFPIVAPGGQYSLKLGNSATGAQAERARYYVHVPTGTAKYILIFRYAVVFEDPNHQLYEQPRFEVKAYDSATGAAIQCANFNFVASSVLPGFKQSTVNSTVWYKDWTTASLDLSDYSGKTVAVDFATGDCDLGGHFGYGYVDLDCKVFESYVYKCNQIGPVTLTAPPGFQTYTWYDPTFTSIVGSGQITAVNNAGVSQTYPVVLTPYPGYGCPDTLYVEVRASTIMSNAGPDTVLCTASNIVQLRANATASDGPLTYQWQPSFGLTCTNCPEPYANLTTSMKYIVKMTDTIGCVRYDTANIVVAPTIHTKVIAPDTVCQFDEVFIRNATPDTFLQIYSWNLDVGGKVLKGSENDSITAIFEQPGLKRILLQVKANVCQVFDSAFVYVRSSPKPFFNLPSAYTCVGDTVSLNVQLENATYYWNVEGQNITDTAHSTPVQLSWNTAGEKKVKLALKGDNVCPVREYSRSVFVRDFPDAKISISGDVCIGGVTSLSAKAHPDYIYDWRPVLYFMSNSTNEVQAQVPQPGYLTLKVIDRWMNTCASSDSIYVSPIFCCDVLLPDAFTPNGDGTNDEFRLITPAEQEVFSFMVANRWGQVLYKSDSRDASWDGTYKGAPQDGGMYLYYVEYMCDNREMKVKKGSFILVR